MLVTQKKIGWFMLLSALLILLSSCGHPNATNNSSKQAIQKKEEIVVSAAASLKNVLTDIQTLYNKNKKYTMTINFASSGTLQHQIEQGAPVDVFLSASKKKMNTLIKKGLIDQAHVKDLVQNQIVLIVPSKQNNQVKSFQDLLKPDVNKVAVGIPETVPAGRYAKEVLTHLGLWDKLQSKFLLSKDVRQVLAYVETNNVDAGLVYYTDALISKKVKTIAFAKPDWHTPITYPIGIIKDSKNHQAAIDFYEFMQTDAAKKIFEKYGFKWIK